MMIQDKYEIVKEIGKGSYSIVYEVKHIFKNERCAMKMEIENDKLSKRLIQNEISNYLTLVKNKNTGIVNIKSFGIFNNQNYIIMSMLDQNIGEYIQEKLDEMNEDEVMGMFCRTYMLIQNLHSSCLIHRDVKPENFLVKNDTKEIFIVDMGLSCKFDSERKSHGMIGTPLYSSWNTHNDEYVYTMKDDIISCFFVFFKIIGGSLPWENLYFKRDSVKNKVMYYMKINYNFSKYYKENNKMCRLISAYEYFIHNEKLPEKFIHYYKSL